MTQKLLVFYKHIWQSQGLQVTKTKLHKSSDLNVKDKSITDRFP